MSNMRTYVIHGERIAANSYNQAQFAYSKLLESRAKQGIEHEFRLYLHKKLVNDAHLARTQFHSK